LWDVPHRKYDPLLPGKIILTCFGESVTDLVLDIVGKVKTVDGLEQEHPGHLLAFSGCKAGIKRSLAFGRVDIIPECLLSFRGRKVAGDHRLHAVKFHQYTVTFLRMWTGIADKSTALLRGDIRIQKQHFHQMSFLSANLHDPAGVFRRVKKVDEDFFWQQGKDPVFRCP
jgi:hypothetical protein